MSNAAERRVRWAVAQMTGTGSVEDNLSKAEQLVAAAAQAGCTLVSLPENTTYMGPEGDKASHAESLEGPAVSRMAEAAQRHKIAVHLGSVVERSDDPVRPYGTSVLLDSAGELRAAYRKTHMFDVDVAGDRSYIESDALTPGPAEPVVAEIDGVVIGLTICFDLRFPWLYRALVDRGAEVMFVPSAFTVPTGAAHWEVLLRARAIETQSFVLAAAQYGRHPTGRKTYGHSLIIHPWGTVLAQVADGGQLAIADLDFEQVPALRRSMPLNSRQPS